MPVLTEYLAQESLQRLQDEFVRALDVPLRIHAPDGTPLTRASELPPRSDCPGLFDRVGPVEAPILLEGELLGHVAVEAPDLPAGDGGACDDRLERMLRLMASVIARRWNRQKLLRTRIAELATMYRLTAEFAGKREIKSVLDLVAATVRELLGAKGVSIRLLSEDRKELVIKAVANLSPEYLEKGPILVSDSKIDQRVIERGQTVYVPDLRSDPRVVYAEEARREGIVSGLCAPLSYKGRAEGVLRVYMDRPYQFDWYERSLLQAIAAQAAAAIANARLYQETMRSARLRHDLMMAGEVQRRMIPERPPEMEGLDIAAVYDPSFDLGGDFYDFHVFPSSNMGLAVCDVVGKGIRASLLMASIRASLRAHAANIYELSEVMARVNHDLCDDTAISDFATLFYGVIDATNRRFTYANAGHSPPLLVRGGQCCHLTTGGGVLGIEPSFTWRHDSMAYQPGDAFVFYTDGLTEALNFKNEMFGLPRLESAVLDGLGQGMTAEALTHHVLWELHHHTGLQTQLDDLTLIVIRVL